MLSHPGNGRLSLRLKDAHRMNLSAQLRELAIDAGRRRNGIVSVDSFPPISV